MKQNILLFLKSLVSNNTAIDGARKKPWYAAVIIFILSIILSVIPSSVLDLKKQGDSYFSSTTYYAREATALFAKDIHDGKSDDKLSIVKVDKNSYLDGDESVNAYYEFDVNNNQKLGFAFQYCSNENAEAWINALTYEANVSFFIFTPDTVYISILNPSNPSLAKRVVTLSCINAYKKLGKDDIRNSYVSDESTTASVNKTWDNWKTLIKKFYNQTRLRNTGIQLALYSGINVVIVLIMGFLVWVLTRGKANPYRLFTVWDSFKIAFWASFTPALLTTGLGFLLTSFTSMLFPLLVGVRVMWLTMKSLRPDGSGYAAN